MDKLLSYTYFVLPDLTYMPRRPHLDHHPPKIYIIKFSRTLDFFSHFHAFSHQNQWETFDDVIAGKRLDFVFSQNFANKRLPKVKNLAMSLITLCTLFPFSTYLASIEIVNCCTRSALSRRTILIFIYIIKSLNKILRCYIFYSRWSTVLVCNLS